MSRLEWGKGPLMFEQGVDQGVLYLDGVCLPWNGLVSVVEKAATPNNTAHYFDGEKLHITQDTESFEATISAYTYPDAFAEYNGYTSHDSHQRFGFSYRTEQDGHRRLHLVYNVLVQDNTRSWTTLSQRPDPSLFAWDISAASVHIPGASPAARLTLESSANPEAYSLIEDILYGTSVTDPRLPTPSELIDIYEVSTLLKITYHGDGTYTASGPDHMVQPLEDGLFVLNAPSVFFLDQDVFVVQSY